MVTQRIVYFDFLRVFAIASVVVLHVACDQIRDVETLSSEWDAFNFYNGIARWGVPVFVMISGYLFLSRDISIKKLYGKYIYRLIMGFVFWSFLYGLFFIYKNAQTDTDYQIRDVVGLMIKGEYHMWFIPMIIGLYMIVPILRTIIKDKKLTEYFLLLAFVFSFFIPECVKLITDFSTGTISAITNRYVNSFIRNLNMKFVSTYVFYFVLGYYLHEYDISIKNKRWIYILGGLGFVSTFALNAAYTWRTGITIDRYFGDDVLNVALEAIFVFVLLKYTTFSNGNSHNLVATLSKYSLGAYWIHIIIKDLLYMNGFDTLLFHPCVSVPVISFVIIFLSFSISALLNKVPVVNKWIV